MINNALFNLRFWFTDFDDFSYFLALGSKGTLIFEPRPQLTQLDFSCGINNSLALNVSANPATKCKTTGAGVW